MRNPCKHCGGIEGVIVEKNGQDTVRCAACNAFAYNAPRTETGRAQRSVSTVHAGIKPGKRSRVLERAGAKCEICGARGNLHVGHILSVADGLKQGLSEAQLNSEDNLLASCEECNLGQGDRSLPPWLAIALVRCRIAITEREQGAA